MAAQRALEREVLQGALRQDASLLPFHREVVGQLLGEDGLCVLAAGLGLPHVLATLLHLHAVHPAGAVLVVGASEKQRGMTMQQLRPKLSAQELPVEVTSLVTTNDRAHLYATSRAVFVTTRILVVDFLTARLSPANVAGMIVCNAHKVTELSGEGFAARLFREGNTGGFLRALTDLPTAFSGGINTVERVLKALGLRRLFLYPRFQSQVRTCLEKRAIDVVELEQDLSPAMEAVQDSLVLMIGDCVKELNKSNRIDCSNLTRDQALFRSFDEIVRRQLDPVWNTVSKKTKQLVYDLKTLRQLADYSLRLDPAAFLAYLEALRASEGTRSVWLFLPAAHALFENAKRRVFKLVKEDQSAAVKRRRVGQEAVGLSKQVEARVEVPPKWELLREVLEEVQAERGRLRAEQEEKLVAGAAGEGGSTFPVLVIAKNGNMARQLQQWLRPPEEGGGAPFMSELWESYLAAWMEQKGQQKGTGGQSSRRGGWRGGRSSRARGRSSSAGATSVASRMAAAAAGGGESNPGERAALLSAARSLPTVAAKSSKTKGKAVVKDSTEEREGEGVASMEAASRVGILEEVYWQVLESNEDILWEVKPFFVILVDPQVAAVRQLEVFRAYQPGHPLRVYFLYYTKSSEKRKYVSTLEREISVFDDLIKMKGYLMIPSGQPLTQLTLAGTSPYHPGAEPTSTGTNAITRKASAPDSSAQTVVVDIREFVSSLPAVLHQRGIDVRPVTLEVGDYILTPDICVERKAIPDLIQSLQSGRLYQQAESMCRHYKKAVLLIEFEQDRAFALQAVEDMEFTISQSSLQSRIALLLLHFPKLRVIWSRSLHATADIFLSLKTKQDQPTAEAAAAVGVPEVRPDGSSASTESLVNQGAVDLLRRLPGVNDRNCHNLMRACGSLAAIAELEKAELARIMGGEKVAQMLHDFLHAPCAAL